MDAEDFRKGCKSDTALLTGVVGEVRQWMPVWKTSQCSQPGNLVRPRSMAMRDFNWSGEGSERVVDGVVPEIGFSAISLIHPTSVKARNAQPFTRAYLVAAGSWESRDQASRQRLIIRTPAPGLEWAINGGRS